MYWAVLELMVMVVKGCIGQIIPRYNPALEHKKCYSSYCMCGVHKQANK